MVSDEMAERAKGRRPMIPLVERLEIVRSIRYVDAAFVETVPDKLETWKQVRFDVLFKGDDWRRRRRGTAGAGLATVGVDVVYFPYTVHTSSTQLRRAIDALDGTRFTDELRTAPGTTCEEGDEEERGGDGEDGVGPSEGAAATEQQEHQAEHPVVDRQQGPARAVEGSARSPGAALGLSCSVSNPPKNVTTAASWKPSGTSSQPSASVPK